MKPGYKQTEVGVIPEEWGITTLGELKPFITSGSRGWASYYSERGDLFVRITNLSREKIYIDLSDSKFVKIPSESREGTRTQLIEHDILISITADIGIIGYIDASVPSPAYINQHIALIRFDHTKTCGKFVSYFLASEQPQKLFRAATDIGAKAGMSLLTVQKIQTILPPLPEQIAIAAVLSDMDALIASTEALISKKRALKQATMQQLLTGQTRLPGFHGEWEVKRLGELLEYEQPTKYLVSSTEYDDSFDIPVLTAGKTFILGKTNETHGIFNNLPVIIFDDFTTGTQLVDFPFKAKSSAMKILKPRNKDVNLGIVYELMQMVDFIMTDHKRYWISEFQNIEVGVPSPKEQIAIAAVLSDMDAELDALASQLAKTRALKQGMMQELLTGRTRLIPKPTESASHAE